jgi:hypothetical protein
LFGLRTPPGAGTAFILRRRGPGLLRGMGDRAILDLSSMLWIYGWIIRLRYSNIYLAAIDFYSIRLTRRSREEMLTPRNSTAEIARQPVIGLALVCAGSIVLASCSSVLSEMPTQVGGLPAGTPQRPAAAPEYPAVHEMPPPRTAAVLTEEEKKKVEAELAAMRAEQARRAKARGLPE